MRRLTTREALFRGGTAVVVGAVCIGLSRSVRTPDVNPCRSVPIGEGCFNRLVFLPRSFPAGGSSGGSGGEGTLHDNECLTDVDCNPGIAHPDRFTSYCSGAREARERIAQGGNQGGTCKTRNNP